MPLKFFYFLFFYTGFGFGTRAVLAVMQKLNKNIQKKIDTDMSLDYFLFSKFSCYGG